MYPPTAPLPSRQSGTVGTSRQMTPAQEAVWRRQQSATRVMVFVILAMSVLLSYDWTGHPPGFSPTAWIVILSAVVVSAMVLIAASYVRSHPPVPVLATRVCPECRRPIPADAALCPYCGLRLP